LFAIQLRQNLPKQNPAEVFGCKARLHPQRGRNVSSCRSGVDQTVFRRLGRSATVSTRSVIHPAVRFARVHDRGFIVAPRQRSGGGSMLDWSAALGAAQDVEGEDHV
jgi:hypothetical protein